MAVPASTYASGFQGSADIASIHVSSGVIWDYRVGSANKLPVCSLKENPVQKHRLTFEVGSQNTEVTQQYEMDVQDAVGHKLRAFEIKRTFPTDPPKFNGVAVVRSWARGASDYIDESGSGLVYIIYDLENGDQIFTRSMLVAQKTSDGSGKSTSVSAGVITGGTGKFGRIAGTAKATSLFDPNSGFNATDFEIEYWMAD
jgi:hypothetical protein